MLHVTPVPCLRDNYAYLIEGDEPGACAVVDPSEYAPVARALAERNLRAGALLATHHHLDHVGGLTELDDDFPDAPVMALPPDARQIIGVTRPVAHNERFSIAGLSVWCLHIPGHTQGAVAYVIEQGGVPAAVFTGDTLFTGGCGRLFEGTPADMHRSLNMVLGALPDATEVYCGHEYTESNLRFALHVEPDNEATRARATRVSERRAQGEPTVPSTMGEERATNPFLRVDQPAVRAFCGCGPEADATEVFGKLRAAKDQFR
jgi:hydroxyacylglutathione hydrolase